MKAEKTMKKTLNCKALSSVSLSVQAKAASDARLARDIQEAEDRAEANAAEEARLRQQELESIDRYSQRIIYSFL